MTYTRIQDGDIVHTSWMNVSDELRQISKIDGIDSEVILSNHIIDVIPLDVLKQKYRKLRGDLEYWILEYLPTCECQFYTYYTIGSA